MEVVKKYLRILAIWTLIAAAAQIIPSLLANEWSSLQFYLFGSVITGAIAALIMTLIDNQM